jgi:hypothetical protein
MQRGAKLTSKLCHRSASPRYRRIWGAHGCGLQRVIAQAMRLLSLPWRWRLKRRARQSSSRLSCGFQEPVCEGRALCYDLRHVKVLVSFSVGFSFAARLQSTLAVGLKCGEPARKSQLLPRQRVCKFRCRCIYVRFERHEASFQRQFVVRGGEWAKIQGREVGEPWKGASTIKSPV